MNELKYKLSYHKWRKENNFSVISNDNLELFFLDKISTEILSTLINDDKSIREVANIMINEFLYDVDKDILYCDIEELFESFLNNGIVETI